MTRIGRWLIDVRDDGWVIAYGTKGGVVTKVRIEDIEARARQRVLPRRRARRVVYN